MATPIGHAFSRRFTLPRAQGWSRRRCSDVVLLLEKQERRRRRRRRGDFDSERGKAVRLELDAMFSAVMAGSELMYDGLPASSLNGQPLAVAVESHLRRPAISAAEELLSGLCAAAGLCLL